MNRTTQHISPNPARDFADAIRAETNNGRDLIDLLHDISQGGYGANHNDRITAANTLLDRGLGKCPKQSPVLSAVEGPATPDTDPDHAPPTEDADVGSTHESHHDAPESPRLVTQIGDSLNQSLGPPPSAHTEPALSLPKGHSREGGNPESYDISHSGEIESPEPLDPFSIQSSIQEYILTITNNGQTLRATLKSIAFADPEDESVITFHRRRAATLLIDRLLGTDPNALRSAVCPDCRRKWSTHDGSHTHTETHPKKTPGRRMSKVDPEALAKVHAKLKQMEDEGILTPDPNAEEIDITPYLPPQDFDLSPYAKEEAAKFWANIELRYERQKAWPAIEERRRKKLEQIYPSHSEDQSKDPPET